MKLTMSELKRMVKEEMMNEAGTIKRMPTKLEREEAETRRKENKRSFWLSLLAGAGLLTGLAVGSHMQGEKYQAAFDNAYNGKQLTPNCLNAFQNPTHNVLLLNIDMACAAGFVAGNHDQTPAVEMAKENGINKKAIESVGSKVKDEIESLREEGPGQIKPKTNESRSANATKITLSELKQLIRSELKRSGLV